MAPQSAPQPFAPPDFDPPRSLVTEDFRLEPLGPQHNESDLAAWMSSVDHIRATPGYPDGKWPPPEGMTLERNLADLVRHAADFAARTGFTFTVLDVADRSTEGRSTEDRSTEDRSDGAHVIGCVYIYPATSPDHDVVVHSWVRADRAHLDRPLADAVRAWLIADWPWQRIDRRGRD